MNERDTGPESAGQAGPLVARPALRRRFLSVRTLLSFAIAAALLVLVWFLNDLSVEEILDRLSRANPWLIVAAFVVYWLNFPLRTLRWRVLLNNAVKHEETTPRYTMWGLFQILYISWFVNGVIPLKIGDVYRAYMARANYGTSLTRTLGTVFTERVLDVVTLILIVLVSSVFVLQLPEVGEDVGRIILVAVIALAVLAAAVFAMLLFGSPIFRRFPKRVGEIYERFHSGVFDSWTWRSGPLLWLLSFAIWSAEMGRLTLVTRAVGLDLGLGTIFFSGAAASLLLAFPTPGGLGAVDGGLIGLLRVAGGVSAGPAGVVAIIDRFISYWCVTVSGAAMFALTRMKR